MAFDQQKIQKKQQEIFCRLLDFLIKLSLQQKNIIFDQMQKQKANKISLFYKTRHLPLNLRTLNDIQEFNQHSERLPHGEDPLTNVIMSVYLRECKQRNIPYQKIDRSLWNLDQWRQKNIKVEQYIVNTLEKWNVQIINAVIIPKIQQLVWEKDHDMKINVFVPSNSEQKEEQGKRYYFFDTIYQALLTYQKNIQEDKQTVQQRISHLIQEIVKRNYTEIDKLFVSKVLQAYNKYHSDGDKYREATNDSFCGMLPPFQQNEKIALIGDWGTNLGDAYSLIDHLVNVEKINYILHLGDVYYAGFPEQFQVIEEYMQALRKTTKRDIKYYCIPGNHDYYTNGGPFLDHIDRNNSSEDVRQKFSFFCLRDEKENVQFLGIDTGKNQHAMSTAINPLFQGTFLQQKQCQWVKRKVNQFKGQTILISHHPLFSAYDPSLGKSTYYGQFNPQINYKLSQQLFDILPKISCWYWGHEHRCVKYTDWAYGVPRCRLLGNSAFQNSEDGLYKEKYTKIKIVDPILEPKRVDEGKWYNHTAAIFSIHRKDNIQVKYIEMPSTYTKKTTQVYYPFSETIMPPKSQDILTNIGYYMKESSGLSLQYFKQRFSQGYIWLDCLPSQIFFQQVNGNTTNLRSYQSYYIKVVNNQEKQGYLYLAKDTCVYVHENKQETSNFKWILVCDQETISTGDSFSILNQENNEDLNTKIAGITGNYYYTLSTQIDKQNKNERLARFQIYHN